MSMASNELNDFLGTGWSFPPAFHKASGGPVMVSGLDDIAQSLHILLNTLPGERILHHAYGSTLYLAVFENINPQTINYISALIGKAILHNEPRVIFLNAELAGQDPEQGILHMRVNFEVISTNTRHNIVFPYYLLEGTQLASNYHLLPGIDE